MLFELESMMAPPALTVLVMGRAGEAALPWKKVAELGSASGSKTERLAQRRRDQQEQHRDRNEDKRGADHPAQEDVRVGDICGAAWGEYAHDHIIQPDAHFEQCRTADGVHPERSADAVAAAGYAALMRGQRVVVPGITNTMVTMLVPLLPRGLLLEATARSQLGRAKPSK